MYWRLSNSGFPIRRPTGSSRKSFRLARKPVHEFDQSCVIIAHSLSSRGIPDDDSNNFDAGDCVLLHENQIFHNCKSIAGWALVFAAPSNPIVAFSKIETGIVK